MRTNQILVLAIFFACFYLDVFADEPEDVIVGSPCGNVREICRAAGFVKGGHKEGKGLNRDCMSDLLLGRSVSGINLNPEQIVDLDMCKAKPHPCLLIIDACDNAANPKGCVKKLLTGESVSGVTAPPAADIAACKSHRDNRQQPKVVPAL